MRKLSFLFILSAIWLFSTADATANVNFHAKISPLKATASASIVTTAFAISNIEIELIPLLSFSPVQSTIEKREPVDFLFSGHNQLNGYYDCKTYISCSYTVVSGCSFKLLFPFHYFW